MFPALDPVLVSLSAPEHFPFSFFFIYFLKLSQFRQVICKKLVGRNETASDGRLSALQLLLDVGQTGNVLFGKNDIGIVGKSGRRRSGRHHFAKIRAHKRVVHGADGL